MLWLKKMLQELLLEAAEAEIDGCSGECPTGGKFDPDNKACKECEQDMRDAMYKAY